MERKNGYVGEREVGFLERERVSKEGMHKRNTPIRDRDWRDILRSGIFSKRGNREELNKRRTVIRVNLRGTLTRDIGFMVYQLGVLEQLKTYHQHNLQQIRRDDFESSAKLNHELPIESVMCKSKFNCFLGLFSLDHN